MSACCPCLWTLEVLKITEESDLAVTSSITIEGKLKVEEIRVKMDTSLPIVMTNSRDAGDLGLHPPGIAQGQWPRQPASVGKSLPKAGESQDVTERGNGTGNGEIDGSSGLFEKRRHSFVQDMARD